MYDDDKPTKAAPFKLQVNTNLTKSSASQCKYSNGNSPDRVSQAHSIPSRMFDSPTRSFGSPVSPRKQK